MSRPRILVLAESLPYPTVKGGDLRTWQHVNALAACSEVGVFGLCSNDARRHAVPDVPLAFWSSSTDPALTSPPPMHVALAARAWLLDPGGHPSDLHFSAHAAAELSALLDRFRPDAVLVEGLWLQRYVDVLRQAGCRVILDCHNVEAAVMRALAAATARPGLEGRVLRDVLPARTAAIERHAIAAVDQVWVCSDEDALVMRELYDPQQQPVVVPNGLQVEAYRDVQTARAERRPDDDLTLLFPGFFAYLPNAIAADFLVDQVFPRLVAACTAARLLLVGPTPSPKLRAAAGDARIVVTGAVPDIRPYLARATAMAVPLFQGGGTHLKVLEAFAAGLPVISTATGAQGLGVEAGRHLLLAHTADEFVEAALAVWGDRGLADQLAANAGALVGERFSWSAVGVRVRQAIDSLGL